MVKSKNPFSTGYTNLMKSLLGVGILSYPSLFSDLGVPVTLLCMVISAIFSNFGLVIFLFLNRNKSLTMSTLTDKKFVFYFVNLVIVLKCISVSISYILTMSEIIDSVIKKESAKKVILTVITLAIAPISTLKTFGKLKITSFLGVGAVVMMVTLTLIRMSLNLGELSPPHQSNHKSAHKSITNAVQPERNVFLAKPTRTGVLGSKKGSDLLKCTFFSFGSFVYSFTCHQNIFTFSNECRMSFRSSVLCTTAVMISSMILYVLFGLPNAYMFKFDDSGFFSSIPNDVITGLMKFFFLFVVIFAIPLQLNAAQNYLEISRPLYRYIFCYCVHIAGLLFTLLNINFKTVISIIGGTVSAFLCYIIAGAYLMYFRRYPDRNNGYYVIDGKMMVMGVGTLIFGVGIFLYKMGSIFRLY